MKCFTCTPIFVPTPELKHHGKEVCQVCGAFFRWMPKPENVEARRKDEQRIVVLRSNEQLTAWERGFIASLDTQGPKRSPKQVATLTKLAEKYGV
jgi:hypothetical protein